MLGPESLATIPEDMLEIYKCNDRLESRLADSQAESNEKSDVVPSGTVSVDTSLSSPLSALAGLVEACSSPYSSTSEGGTELAVLDVRFLRWGG